MTFALCRDSDPGDAASVGVRGLNKASHYAWITVYSEVSKANFAKGTSSPLLAQSEGWVQVEVLFGHNTCAYVSRKIGFHSLFRAGHFLGRL